MENFNQKSSRAAILNNNYRAQEFEQFTKEVNEELKKAYEIAKIRCSLSPEEQDELSPEYFGLGYVSGTGKIVIRGLAIIQEYVQFDYEVTKFLNAGQINKIIVTPDRLRNCFNWIFSKTQFCCFLENKPNSLDESMEQIDLDVPYEKITETTIRYAVESYLSNLERQKRGEYIYRPQHEAVFTLKTIEEICEFLDERLSFSIDRSIDNEQELISLALLKSNLQQTVNEMKGLIINK